MPASAGAEKAVGWPRRGYDRGATGRTPAVGRIRQPHLAWQADLAAREYFLQAVPRPGQTVWSPADSSALPPLSAEARRAWGLAPPLLDVAGNGQPVDPPWAPGARWGKFLPEVPGLQRLSWTTTWGENAHFQMHSFEAGRDHPRLIWDVPMAGATYSPLVIVVDLDGDGALEAAVSTWYGVMAYDLATGREKYRCLYRQGHGRQYGFFGAYAPPGGPVYLGVIGDFAGHIGVLAFREGTLKDLWVHLFDPQSEQGIDRRFTINTIGPDPLGDFDGDGRGEALMNVFNEAGDERWHLLAYDLETGQHRWDLPDVYLHGHVDVDGDGREELLAQHCPGRPVGTHGELRLYRLRPTAPPVLWWSHPFARWSLAPLPELPLTRLTGATKGMEAPVAGPLEGSPGSTVFYTAPGEKPGDPESLQALQCHGGQPTVAWRIEGPLGVLLDAAAVAEGRVLVRARWGRAEENGDKRGTEEEGRAVLRGKGVELTAMACQRLVRDAPQPLVLQDTTGRPQIVVADPLDRIRGWALSRGPEAALRLRWEHPGRAMTTQVPQMLGLTAGDVDRDGQEEVLFVQETREGYSRLVALGLDGQERWHFDFPGFNGRAPVWNEGGTTIWAVGHFLSPDRWDVLVSNRRSIMHSDETVVVNVEARRVVWHRDILEVRPSWSTTPWPHTRGYGGGLVALGDFDGDGLDDIALCYPAEYSVVKGNTGEQLLLETTGPLPGTDHFWVIGGTPLVADLNGDGHPETLWTSPSIVLAWTQRQGRAALLWRTEPNDGATGQPAWGDTDGDGRREIGLPGFADGFRCLDPATGQSLWTVPAQGDGVSNCVAADLNGDGIEEFLYANGSRLLAVARRPGAASPILWQIDLPAPIRNVAVADVDGDGLAEILAGGSDGVLYGVD